MARRVVDGDRLLSHFCFVFWMPHTLEDNYPWSIWPCLSPEDYQSIMGWCREPKLIGPQLDSDCCLPRCSCRDSRFNAVVHLDFLALPIFESLCGKQRNLGSPNMSGLLGDWLSTLLLLLFVGTWQKCRCRSSLFMWSVCFVFLATLLVPRSPCDGWWNCW